MTIVINPGTGSVPNATLEHAQFNIEVLCLEAGATLAVGAVGTDQGGGRWQFAVTGPDGSLHDVEMPGIPLHRVRWMDFDDQNIWDFPRLYVDGSSWVWKYALGVLVEENPDE